jgi:signal transduction histidine kinase
MIYKNKIKEEFKDESQVLNKNQRIYAKQIAQLYKHIPIGVVVTLVNSLILTFILWKVVSHSALIAWFLAILAVLFFRYLLFFKFERSSQTRAEVARWEMWLIFSIVFSGIVWGSAGIFLFPIDAIAHQIFIAFVLGGMVAGAAGTYSVIIKSFLAYSLPAILPVIIRFFIIGDDIHIAMGGMVLLFWILMFSTAKRINAVIVSSLKLQFEHSDLINHSDGLQKNHNERKILSKRLIDLLEKNRNQIAMELHEHIGQTLASLKIDIEVLHSQLEPADAKLEFQIRAAKEKTFKILEDVKNISNGLKPGILNVLGLVSSLEGLFSEIQESTSIQVNFFVRDIPERFDPEKELAIYRIIQEALNNITKHARAKNVYVSLLKKGEVISLSVEDDGIGFDQREAMKISKWQGALGLIIMQERAIQLDGEFTLESTMGKGTIVMVEIPI